MPLRWAKTGLPVLRGFNVPLIQLGPSTTYIGWQFTFTRGSFRIPEDKLWKLLNSFCELLGHRIVSKSVLRRFIGLVMMTQFAMPPWLEVCSRPESCRWNKFLLPHNWNSVSVIHWFFVSQRVTVG